MQTTRLLALCLFILLLPALFLRPTMPKNNNTVKIGGQVWMKKDLDNGKIYSENELKNACPSGWHVANIDDWEKLFKSIGASHKCGNWGYYYEKGDECDYNIWVHAGRLLKSTSFNGIDSIGFSILPNADTFGNKGEQATYWAIGARNNWLCFTKKDDASDNCGNDSDEKYLIRCVK